MIGNRLASAADWTRLGLEAQYVIGLRLLRMAAGGPQLTLNVRAWATRKPSC
jgi:hypothetical protein